jgi:hypothetical protein
MALAIWRIDGGEQDGAVVEGDALDGIEVCCRKGACLELCTFDTALGPSDAAPGAGRNGKATESNNGTRRRSTPGNQEE